MIIQRKSTCLVEKLSSFLLPRRPTKGKTKHLFRATGRSLTPHADLNPTGHFDLKPFNFNVIALIFNNGSFRFLKS